MLCSGVSVIPAHRSPKGLDSHWSATKRVGAALVPRCDTDPTTAQPLPGFFWVDWWPGSPKELLLCTKPLQGSEISGNAARLTQSVVSMLLSPHRSALFILLGDLEEMLLAETPFKWTCSGP